MPITKAVLSKEDIESLKIKKKSKSKTRILGSIFSLLVLLIVYLCVGCDSSNSTFYFFRIFIIVINVFIFMGSLKDVNFYNDLKEKQKYVGTVKVKKKEYFYDDESNYESYVVNFDEWRIGNKSFKEDFWNIINEGDEFYVEQAVNSGFILKLEKDKKDFKIGLIW
ncbi:hypothetical protein [Flavobacterium geliluteum]|uniref:Uncharacterized protein n=1 Tax=Flavobacterium geliluteum TaxID=2816120 RepID=A0A940X823_9FLAO|nr:hypothetical protein [Flavobacterium geliluteum]MBP4138634.1 hypothetical protein [Flavobacterium geliluteum]